MPVSRGCVRIKCEKGRERGLTSNGSVGLGVLDALAANGEELGVNLPESAGSVNRGKGHLTLELGLIDAAELVGARGIVPQVSSKDGLLESGQEVLKERLLLLGLDGVEVAEGETDEAVGGRVLDERL